MALTRRKFLAGLISAVMAVTLMVGIPASAFATDATSGSFTVTSSSINAIAGTQANMSSYVNSATVTPSGSDYHYDYVVTSGSSYATVNKHSGVLTPTSAGTTVVTVSLMAGTVSGADNVVLASHTITVTIASSSTYGYQGNPQAVYMNSPSVSSWGYDATNGYTDVIGTAMTIDSNGYLNFDYSTSYGIGPHDIFYYENTINPTHLYVEDADGNILAYLGDSELNGTYMTLTQVNGSKQRFNLAIDADSLGIDSGTYKLVYTSTYSAGNTNNPPLKTTGATITFVFTV